MEDVCRGGGGKRWLVGLLALAVCVGAGGRAAASLTEERVLLLYNSANADSLAVRNMYVAARPGVLEIDLADSSLPAGSIPRTEYLTKVRAPLLGYLNNGGANPRSRQVIAIATTRGLPARIDGVNEFDGQLRSTWASLESELSLVQQDLEAAGESFLEFRRSSFVANPYYRLFDQPITGFDRSGIETQRAFEFVVAAWRATGLTAGDVYFVCRLDAAPLGAISALENIQSLINRSQDLLVAPCNTQALLDEYGCAQQLDRASFEPLIPGVDDFLRTRQLLQGAGVAVRHDETFDFVEGHELVDQATPLLVLGSYGENHSLSIGGQACGENPPGVGTYVFTYTNLHPGAMFIAFESFNGNSIVTGGGRGGQGQALDFIAQGGSFTIAHVAEPFTIAVADLEMLSSNMILHGLTFAEAAYSAIPALSWQNTPVGDPLARMRVPGARFGDLNADGVVNASDLAILLGAWGTDDCVADVSGDGVVNATDLAAVLGGWGG